MTVVGEMERPSIRFPCRRIIPSETSPIRFPALGWYWANTKLEHHCSWCMGDVDVLGDESATWCPRCDVPEADQPAVDADLGDGTS